MTQSLHKDQLTALSSLSPDVLAKLMPLMNKHGLELLCEILANVMFYKSATALSAHQKKRIRDAVGENIVDFRKLVNSRMSDASRRHAILKNATAIATIVRASKATVSKFRASETRIIEENECRTGENARQEVGGWGTGERATGEESEQCRKRDEREQRENAGTFSPTEEGEKTHYGVSQEHQECLFNPVSGATADIQKGV